MIRTCKKEDERLLLKFLYQKPVYHTFLIADIQVYGFDKDYQKVYIQEEDGTCQGIILQYYNNLLIAGSQPHLDYETVLSLTGPPITTIMGEAGIIAEVSKRLTRPALFTRKNLFTLTEPVPPDSSADTEIASIAQAAEIHEFLMSIPEMQPLYKESDMIRNRISNDEGLHVFIRDQGRIIAHGNSAGGTDQTSMMGGICVAREYRRRGYGSQIVRRIALELQKQGKLPCVFADEGVVSRFFKDLMFEKYGEWGTIQIQE